MPPGNLGVQFTKDETGQRVVTAIRPAGSVPAWNAHCHATGLLEHMVKVGDVWTRLDDDLLVSELNESQLKCLLQKCSNRLHFWRGSELTAV